MVYSSPLELLGFVVVLLIGLRSLYNFVLFVYTVYVAGELKHHVNLRRFGPWAGKKRFILFIGHFNWLISPLFWHMDVKL